MTGTAACTTSPSTSSSTSSMAATASTATLATDDEKAYFAAMSAERERRYKVLGFHPQKEIYCNQLLPYGDKLDDESQRMLREIKANLARAIACREFTPGAWFWVGRLATYIKLYSLKFSLADHVQFIKVLLSLLEMPFLEPFRLSRICSVLSTLLRKSKRLSPADVQIDWRPLYKLVLIYLDKKTSKGQFYRFYSSIENHLMSLVEKAAPYFPPGTTQQIMDEIFPQLYPLDTGKYCDTFAILSMFLNYTDDYHLWMEHFLNLWDTYQNPAWNSEIMNKLAMLARNNVGRIDWEPHLATLYARILRSMGLPVYYKTMKGSRCQTLTMNAVADFIAYTLGPHSTSQSHLSHLLGTLESFIHPANTGKWTSKIGEVLGLIAENVVKRLIRERFRPHPWKWQTPAEHRLTDACVTAFVESMRPIAFQALFSRVAATDVGYIFSLLTELRPELIIPGVVERVYATLDSLTEPHKLTAALQCLVSVARALVAGHNGYTAGKTHVVPILFAVLPGIDPNDFRKTAITLDFLTSFALLVPIIDCSQAAQYHTDLTEEELLICDQTAEFETFVLQYLDRVFAVIEASAQQPIRLEQNQSVEVRSHMEALADASLLSSTQGIMGQCSPAIVAAATHKVIEFTRSHQFESVVAAPMVGSLVRVISRVAGPEMHRAFLPWVVSSIHTYVAEHEDCAASEKQSDELLYYLTLLECYVRGNALCLLDAADDVMAVFELVRDFACLVTTNNATSIVANYLGIVSGLQTLDVVSSPESFERPLSEFLPIRHWGVKSTRPVVWYQPDERARAICERMVHRYLPVYLEKFDRFSSGEVQVKREVLERDLLAVLALLKSANFLPNWSDVEEPLYAEGESAVRRGAIDVQLGYEQLVVEMPSGGGNVRLAMVRSLCRLQEKVLRDCEDDIKTQQLLVVLWDTVHMKRHSRTAFKAQFKGYTNTKLFQEHTLCRRPLDIRAVVATRVLIQQDCREQLSWPEFTATHVTIMRHVLNSCTSRYALVRRVAQARMFGMMQKFPLASRFLLDDIERLLALDANAEHDQFKGVLFVIYGTRVGRMVLQHNWDTVERLWLGLLRTNLSEKPSVVRLMDGIVLALKDEFPTVAVHLEIPDKCVRLALELMPAGEPAVGVEEMEAGAERLSATNARNRVSYERLLTQILDITHNNSLHWRYGRMASVMINSLIHPQVAYPQSVIQYAVHNLIHESIEERKMAVKMLRSALIQMKPEHVKVRLDAQALAIVRPTDRPDVDRMAPGMRADNRFLQYDIETVPRTQEAWDEPCYVYKTMGYFGWPTGYEVYAPSAQQPQVNRDRELMSAAERVVFDFFVEESNVARLVHFWSMEEKRGEEKFRRSRLLIVKGLCDLFGMRVVDLLLPQIERLIRENKNLESNHRCAAELMGGIMRGVKHWPYAETARLYEERLVPLVRLAVSSVTVETDAFWGTCFATAAENMDPRRQYWLHEVLLEDPLREERSFVDCIRIYCLQGPFNQHVWRMNTVSHRLLDYLRPFLNHSFQNVRERLGSLLINIFEADLVFKGANDPECPRIKDFIAEMLARLQMLHGEVPEGVKKIVKKADDSTAEATADAIMAVEEPASESVAAYEEAVRLFKTVCHWITGIINRSTNGNRAEFFDLLPLICRLERCEQDDELADSCSALLAMMAQALTLADVMPVALDSIEAVSRMASWSARVAVLDVMQVLVFNNMSIVLSQPRWVQQVQEIVLRLMEDTVLEVRSKASQVLCGLLHCSFLPATDKLLELFKRKCRTKVAPKSLRRTRTASAAADGAEAATDGTQAVDAEPLRKRHMGVMGLCAFIAAYPYEIPDFVPDVFEHLGAHLNDPQPIPSTIRLAVGNFKRTHHDNWAAHKQKFTENQLAVLSDLTIPPSYYA